MQVPGLLSLGISVSISELETGLWLTLSSAPDPNEATKKLREKLADILQSQAKGADEAAPNVNTAPSNAATVGSESSSGAGSPANSSLNIPDAHVTPASKRRSRRPFTTAEDDALLKGYAIHGFQWTLIQQDKRLNLSHRRATDLRDRFRTKCPHAYRNGGPVSAREVNQAPTSNSGAFGPAPQDRPQSSESTPSKNHTSYRPSDTHSRHTSSSGPIDPSLLPPPHGFFESSANIPSAAGLLAFPLDENPASGASSPWDNTLAPMVWDELG